MAETFGAAAGVLSVVSLSIQLAESVQKVKKLHADISQACPRLADLVDEVEETCGLMKVLENDVQYTGIAASPLIRSCLSHSREAANNFARVISELESYAKRKRIRGGLRFAFSQEEITGMLNRMERAKGRLVMAYMQHRSAVQQQQYALQEQQFSFQRQQSALQQTQHDIVIQQFADIRQRMEALFTNPQPRHVSKTVVRTDHRRKFKRILEVRIPGWMNNTVWQFALDISICGWQFTMRTYGIVSQNAPIIQACQVGDTAAMQRLFDIGAASPFDQTSGGFDLVSYCVLSANINTIRFLLSYGLTSNNRPISYGLFWTCSLLHEHEETTIDADVQFLCTQYDDDDARTKEDSCYETMATSLDFCTTEEAASLRFWRGVYYCRMTAFLDTSTSPSINALLTSYDPGHLGGKTQLQLLAALYARVLAVWLHHDSLLLEGAKAKVEDFIHQAIINGHDVHAGSNDYTPLNMMLGSFCCFWPDGDKIPQSALHKALITWLRLFERAGVNLREYAKEESRRSELQQFPHTPGAMFIYWYNDVLEDILRWTSPWTPLPLALSFGDKSSDWRIVLLGFAEECARDFWRLVEAQAEEAFYDQCLLPGGWVEN